MAVAGVTWSIGKARRKRLKPLNWHASVKTWRTLGIGFTGLRLSSYRT